MREKHGEFVYLSWEGRPPYEVVRGHVTAEEFRVALVAGHPDLRESDAIPEEAPVHCYGRWAQDAWARSCGNDATFYPYRRSGRGRFPVTLACYAGERPGFRDDDAAEGV